MSRRKQSNPKPIKREDEDWSDSEKDQSVISGNEGGGSADSTPQEPPIEDDSCPPSESILNPVDDIESQPSTRFDNGHQQFGTPVDESEVSTRNLQDHVSDASNDDDVNDTIEESKKQRSSPALSSWRKDTPRRFAGDLQWLDEPYVQAKKMKLEDKVTPKLRLNASLATDPALRPATVAALTVRPETKSPANLTPPLPAVIQNAITSGRLFIIPTDGKDSITVEQARSIPLICPPCGIRFSSASTLEAHQTFYCAHRPRVDEESVNDEDDEKIGKFDVRKAYACPHCSYSADKKVSLNRHMRMHAASPVPPSVPPVTITIGNPTNGSVNEEAERYCQNCDIRFSSLKTYRAHKTHYCSTRHVVKDLPPAPKASPPASASPGDSPPPQPCLALPTNPILIVPYSLFRGASVLAGPALPAPDTACFLLPNGALQPMTRGLSTPSIGTGAPTVLRAANKPCSTSALSSNQTISSSVPLDLSMRRSLIARDEKENRVSPVLSLPSSESPNSHRSSSPRVRSLPGRQSSPLPSPSSELALRLAEIPPPPVPGVLVKQGVSRCKECNIVFCRHENFVAHKKHYCQSRENPASSPPPSTTPSPPLYQLICAACGIKFASLDNLAAHQAFYCPKRPEPPEQQTRCPKCKVVIESGSSHSCSIGPTGGWRCPVCGAISPTAGAAQRHMDAHQGVKAFRCTICRYKGNTLRGMRTHIRMHFEKRGTDLQEENYITCVIDDENMVKTPEPAPAPATAPNITPEEISTQPKVNGTSETMKSPQPPVTISSNVKPEREDTPPLEESLDPTKTGPSHTGEASNNNNNSTSHVNTPPTNCTEASLL